MTSYTPTQADNEVLECLNAKRSFSVVAGAGAGKTMSLVEALRVLINVDGKRMLRDGQKVVCITYTNRAAEVIRARLRQNPLFVICTLHSFLWSEMRHFPNSIRESLRLAVLPSYICKYRDDDNGGSSKKAIEARAKAAELEDVVSKIDLVAEFRYGDNNPYSNFLLGDIGHDDLILIASDMIRKKRPFRRVLAQKYPYLFVDEAQDASPHIIAAFNALCDGEGFPIVGYFGDPMQQIYENGVGEFLGPPGSKVITKVENFRSVPEVIGLLNAFRTDVKQVPAGKNLLVSGTVQITLAEAEEPLGLRKQYNDEQLQRAQVRLAEAIERWGWNENCEAKQLFLVRRMIARRLGFIQLHDLFTGAYASSRATNAYEDGTHLVLKPFLETIVPLVSARRVENVEAVMRILTSRTVAFRAGGVHEKKSIGNVRRIANEVTAKLVQYFDAMPLGAVLRYCRDERIVQVSDRLCSHLDREARKEVFDESKHAEEKADWLADAFFNMRGVEVESYCRFFKENTPYSTQHGVKGEEYNDVIVVFDDIEAAWNNYGFAKMLAPGSAGEAKDSQISRSRKLAYVCFSRAICNLRILLFTRNANVAASELCNKRLFREEQINILEARSA